MPKARTVSVQFVDFCQIDLSPENLELFLEETNNKAGCLEALVSEVQRGFKLALSASDNNAAFKASLFCQDAKSKYAGYMLTADAPTLAEAIDLLYFKHFVLAERNWLPFLQKVRPATLYR